MIKKEEVIVMRAIAICFKPYLKPEEALIYCNLARTQFLRKCEDVGVHKNSAGYFSKEDLDRICTRDMSHFIQAIKKGRNCLEKGR
jgi:hypothetical protein